jgi:hypothetical protein
MPDSKDWITSREAEQELRISRQMFFYYVNKGRIRKQPTEKRGATLYNRGDILRLKAHIHTQEDIDHVFIDWVTPNDLPNTLALDILVYQEPVIGDYKLYLSWLKRNPHITLAAFNADDREEVLSYINVLPLAEDVIMSIMRGERDEHSITPEEIDDGSREGDYFLLAESAVTKPGEVKFINELLRELSDYWCDLWPKRKLRKIYAQTYSDSGLFLVQKMFFAPMYGYPEDAYVLDLTRKNPSRFVQGFQDCINAKADQ